MRTIVVNNICKSSSKRNHEEYIHILGRDEDFKRKHIKIKGFYNYFCVQESYAEHHSLKRFVGLHKIEEGDFNTLITNEKVAKVYFTSDEAMNRVEYRIRQDDGFRTWENKVKKEDRFRILSGIKSGIVDDGNSF